MPCGWPRKGKARWAACPPPIPMLRGLCPWRKAGPQAARPPRDSWAGRPGFDEGVPWPLPICGIARPVWPEVAAKVNSPQGHWSLRPVQRTKAPSVRDAAWARGEIDRFILSKLEGKGLAPVGDADPYTLLRRVTLDLTGLLPTPEEVKAFAAEPTLEKVVDRLLASPKIALKRLKSWTLKSWVWKRSGRSRSKTSQHL